eukprot:250757-Chlamydomonas_euryale.AAC.26
MYSWSSDGVVSEDILVWPPVLTRGGVSAASGARHHACQLPAVGPPSLPPPLRPGDGTSRISKSGKLSDGMVDRGALASDANLARASAHTVPPPAGVAGAAARQALLLPA